MDEKKLSEIKEKLEKEKEELLGKIAEHGKSKRFGDNQVDDYSPEADEAEEFSNDAGIGQAFRERLEEVENAINKINSGKYGTCERCAQPILPEILFTSPTRKICGDCQKKED